jgi:hypothetical protein
MSIRAGLADVEGPDWENVPSLYSAAPEFARTTGSGPTEASETHPELDQLREERDRLQERVSSAYRKVAEMRQDLLIIDPDPESASATVSVEDPKGSMVEEQLARRKALVDTLENKNARLERMGPEQMPEVLALLEIEDGPSAQSSQALREAQAKAAALRRAGVPPHDQRLKLLETEIGVHQSLLSAQLESIRRAQRTKLKIENVGFAWARERYESILERKDRIGDYLEAKAGYLSEKAVLTKSEERYRIAELNSFPAERIRNWRRLPAPSR